MINERPAVLFDISAVCSAGFDTMTQKVRELCRVFRRFFYFSIVICSNLRFFLTMHKLIVIDFDN